ncbi:hypothetical protein [Lactobacillus sp. Sy-1]|uniref:hypothetical protein n=1 Tax=Lactobacillus sp. Sy-1 TaxID=2109645 RepID=UPI001C5A9CDB|nr:hypothetical protein [Lactobacillus sp. Sy-1]MBW1606343.1 hypothetical protein [Lactobacillus sp. Sy-1]
MKKLKIIPLIATFTMLLIPTYQTAKAAPGLNSSYWLHSRTVTVKKRVTAYKVKVASVGFKDHFVAKKVIKAGTKIKAQNGGASWYWIVKGHGMHNNANHFWVININNSKWIK